MQTSGIKININSSDKLLFDESEKIEKVIKFAVKQAVLKKELSQTQTPNSESEFTVEQTENTEKFSHR